LQFAVSRLASSWNGLCKYGANAKELGGVVGEDKAEKEDDGSNRALARLRFEVLAFRLTIRLGELDVEVDVVEEESEEEEEDADEEDEEE
jgi:hypothetical protein